MNKWQREQQEKLKAVRTPSYEDEQQAKIWAAAYQAAVDTLKSFLKEDQHRLVRTLNKNEMGQLVHSITGAYAATRAEPEGSCGLLKTNRAAERGVRR